MVIPLVFQEQVILKRYSLIFSHLVILNNSLSLKGTITDLGKALTIKVEIIADNQVMEPITECRSLVLNAKQVHYFENFIVQVASMPAYCFLVINFSLYMLQTRLIKGIFFRVKTYLMINVINFVDSPYKYYSFKIKFIYLLLFLK